jgi:hypothetical protein
MYNYETSYLFHLYKSGIISGSTTLLLTHYNYLYKIRSETYNIMSLIRYRMITKTILLRVNREERFTPLTLIPRPSHNNWIITYINTSEIFKNQQCNS